METSVKERLVQFLKSQNLSQKKFQEAIGASNGYVNNISKGLGVEKISAIKQRFPQLNIEWLLTGKGDMLNEETDSEQKKPQSSSDQSSELVEALRSHIADLQAERDRLLDEREELKAEIDRLRLSLGMAPVKKEKTA